MPLLSIFEIMKKPIQPRNYIVTATGEQGAALDPLGRVVVF